MEKVRARFGGLEDIAKTIALPEDHPPHRMPTFPALERTAVMSFLDTSTLRFGAGDRSFVALFRSPTYPLWVDGSMLGSIYNRVTGTGLNIGGSQSESVSANTELGTHIAGSAIMNRQLEYPLVHHSGDLFYSLGMRVNLSTSQMVFAIELVNCTGGLDACSMQLEGINSSGEKVGIHTSGTKVVSGTNIVFHYTPDPTFFAIRLVGATFTASTAGFGCGDYYCGVCPAGVSSALIVPSATVVPRLWPFFPPPEMATSTLPYESVRATAVSVLISNVSAVMSKEGTVSAARLPVSTKGALDPTSWEAFGNVHPKDRYYGALENGLYAFTLPDAASEKFVDGVQGNQPGNTIGPRRGVFDISSSAFVYAIVVEDLDGNTVTQAAVRLHRHIEFRTTSRLFQTTFSKISLESYHLAQMALADLGSFSENPVHPLVVAGMVSKAAKMAWPHLKPLAAQAAVHLGNKAAGWVNRNLVGNMTQKQMVVPTSQSTGKKKKAKKAKKQKQKNGKK